MGIYTGHNPSSQDDIEDETVSQHQIEVLGNEVDSIYSMVEKMTKQLKENTRVINNMMECIAQQSGKSIGEILYDYPVKNHIRRLEEL